MIDPLFSAAGSAALLIPDISRAAFAADRQNTERQGITNARNVLSSSFALAGGIAGAGISLLSFGTLSVPATTTGASVGGAVGSVVPDAAIGVGNVLYQIPGVREATNWLMHALGAPEVR